MTTVSLENELQIADDMHSRYKVEEHPQNRAEIISITDLLKTEINIPDYQRPYKWDESNIDQLINDIFLHRDKMAYRIGTIVIHLNNANNVITKDIVDGQQRFLSLLLIVHALSKVVEEGVGFEASTIQKILELKKQLNLSRISFFDNASVSQLSTNYQHALRTVNKYDDKAILFFLEKCEVVVFYLSDVTEAFQFFDAQNARGKDLDPHDLLKAFHLREFDPAEIALKNNAIVTWEAMKQSDISEIFSKYLYRIKGWSNKSHCRGFGKKDIHLFKGVNLATTHSYNYIKPLMITHKFVDNYNSNFEREIDGSKMNFPFQIDQLIINGRRFFEYVAHYKGIIEAFVSNASKIDQINKQSGELVNLIFNNCYNYRDGEKSIKYLFECALIFYIDKFGYSEIDLFIEKAFIWCFILRFKYQRLGFDSIDNYVVEFNMFDAIKNARHPSAVMTMKIAVPSLSDVEKYQSKNSRMESTIAKFFKTKTYYAN